MNSLINSNTRIIDLTVGDLLRILNNEKQQKPTMHSSKNLVYGISGIAKLFGCSKTTAHSYKGIISDAITQIGRKIIVDADKALELMREHKETK